MLDGPRLNGDEECLSEMGEVDRGYIENPKLRTLNPDDLDRYRTVPWRVPRKLFPSSSDRVLASGSALDAETARTPAEP